jgi:proliferating cell nuclear antigen PCNA
MNILIHDLAKADAFTALFQHIRLFTDNVNIQFETERMYIQTMDNARVSIVEMAIPATWFSEYTLESAVSLGINSTILFKVLSTRDKGQTIQLAYDTDDSDKLALHFTGGTDGKETVFEKHFEIPLIDLDDDMMNIPDTEAQAEFSLSSAHFAGLVNQLRLFGDTMEIRCTEERIELYSHSQDSGKMCVEMRIDDLTEFAIDEGGEVNLSFSLSYLHNICMYNKIAKEISVRLTDAFPMKLVYDLGENARLTFYLAPKIGDD